MYGGGVFVCLFCFVLFCLFSFSFAVPTVFVSELFVCYIVAGICYASSRCFLLSCWKCVLSDVSFVFLCAADIVYTESGQNLQELCQE